MLSKRHGWSGERMSKFTKNGKWHIDWTVLIPSPPMQVTLAISCVVIGLVSAYIVFSNIPAVG